MLKIDDNDWYTIGDRKALINLKAYLVAGIDFQKIEVTDFEPDNFIKLSMPKAEIILLNIPPNEIYSLYSNHLTSGLNSVMKN